MQTTDTLPLPSSLTFAQREAARAAAMVADLTGLECTDPVFHRLFAESLWPSKGMVADTAGISLDVEVDSDGVFHWTYGRVGDPIEFAQLWGAPVTHERAHRIVTSGLIPIEHQREVIAQVNEWADGFEGMTELPFGRELPELAIAVLRGRE